MLTNRTLNRLGFGNDVTTRWNSYAFDFICWFIGGVLVATDSSVFIRSHIVWNRWKRSIKVCLSQRRTINVNTVYFVHHGKSGEILQSVARSLFTRTINEHTIANVCLNLSSLLKIIYIMIKYIHHIPVIVGIFSTKFEFTETGVVTQRINKS